MTGQFYPAYSKDQDRLAQVRYVAGMAHFNEAEPEKLLGQPTIAFLLRMLDECHARTTPRSHVVMAPALAPEPMPEAYKSQGWGRGMFIAGAASGVTPKRKRRAPPQEGP